MALGQYQFFLLLSAALLLVTGVFADGESDGSADTGDWTPIKNFKNPHVHELAEYAVTAYNYQARKHLKFHSIVYGEIQWLPRGTNYRFVIAAIDGENLTITNSYIARVFENTEVGDKTLQAFKPINE